MRIEGPAGVITAADLAVRPVPLIVPPGVEVADAAHPILADDEVRYVGQPVAAVLARSRAEAEDALEQVIVDYEPFEAEPEELLRWRKAGGDVEAAFAAAAHVVRTRHVIPRAVAAPIEPRGCVAQAEGDVLRVWLSAQDIHRPRAGLAHALDRPPESIHVTLADTGGAFGSKGPPAPEVVVAAVAAIDLGRPVKWVETRSENFLAAYQGRGVEGDVELALDGDGRMLGVRARLVADTGAYLQQATAVPPHTMGMLMTGAYDIAAADIEVVGVRSPTGCRPARCAGAGRPEACYLLERTVDAAARELGIDRRRAAAPQPRHRVPARDAARLHLRLRRLRAVPGQGDRARRRAAARVPGSGSRSTSSAPAASGRARRWTRADDGRVIVRSSSFPHGQGHDTIYAQIVADRLGIPIEDVELRFGDSAEAPAGVGTFGGRSIPMAGRPSRSPPTGSPRVRRARPCGSSRRWCSARAPTRRSSRSTRRPAS